MNMFALKRHVFVCTGGKPAGDKKGMCHTRDGAGILRRLVEELDERELSGDVMVSTASCFGICDKGPIMVVYPEGVWYKGVTPEHVETIVERHLEGGQAVEEWVL
jgi:(2Fe-2S) ferredoxin